MFFTSSCTWNYAQKFFYGKFLCLKVFEVNLKLCCYNSCPGPETNQMWSKHGFHKYIDCYGLERHVAAIWVKLEQKLCRKENFGREWRMTAYNWPKVKWLCYSSIKPAFQCFLHLGNMYFSSWGISFFFYVSFQQIWSGLSWSISEKFEKKPAWTIGVSIIQYCSISVTFRRIFFFISNLRS